MAEPHLDHPGDVHWFSGYEPAKLLGECPHPDCPHNALTTVAWGPDLNRYELVECDAECGGRCRAWIDGQGIVTSMWLSTAPPPPPRQRCVYCGTMNYEPGYGCHQCGTATVEDVGGHVNREHGEEAHHD